MGDTAYNMVGTSGRKCQCSTAPKTWLGHWSRATGLAIPASCCVSGCGNAPEVGAHLRIVGWDARTPWILPFCQYHNKRPAHVAMNLKWGVTAVAAATHDCT